MLYFLLLLAISLAVMFTKTFPLGGKKGSAPAVVDWSADLQSKIAYQRVNLISLVALLLLGTAFDLIPRVVSVLTVLAVFLILMLPLRFAFSEEGITVNGRLLRSWTDLKSFAVRERRLFLKGEGRLNFLSLYLPRDRELSSTAMNLVRKKLKKGDAAQSGKRFSSGKRRS